MNASKRKSNNSYDYWATPQWMFDQLNDEFKFTTDVCASKENHKCDKYFTKEQNGLKQKWTGVCWCNPPYGRGEIDKWMEKAYESSLEGATVVCLVPSATDTKWWHNYVMKGKVRFVKGRVKFVIDNIDDKPAPFSSAIVVFSAAKAVKTNQGNMYSSSVLQWNPFMGCEFDCIYCGSSFKRLAKRQKQRCMKCYNYEPHTHPKRLTDYLPKTKEGEFIFTCASADISFCPTTYFKKIIVRIRELPDRTFLLQSKDPKTFNRVDIPDNVILGTTLETNRDDLYQGISKAPFPSQRFEDFAKVDHNRKMITIEPILDFDLDVMVKWVKEISPTVVWLGYDSKNNNLVEPSYEKFNHFHQTLKDAGINVILKTVKR